ncbi:MAG: sulfate reduction electron transfer complex DsrMKJOP subunit DsrO [Thermodesulfobacteriota bacterium]
MNLARRIFLRGVGLFLLSLGIKPSWGMLASKGSSNFQKNPKALNGSRWAMAIDLKKCLPNCQDCINACHSAHNVPDFGNSKDEIKWIWREPLPNVFVGQGLENFNSPWKNKPVIVLCNHCANPPCVRVCPTQATFQREDGVVMMDYHRCIGCRFCIAGCPYGARSMNYRDPRPYIKKINPKFPTRTKGVVEKCNFCVERLAEGLLPACVEACPEKAIIFGDLKDTQSELHQILKTRFPIRRRSELGTQPQVYYLI